MIHLMFVRWGMDAVILRTFLFEGVTAFIRELEVLIWYDKLGSSGTEEKDIFKIRYGCPAHITPLQLRES